MSGHWSDHLIPEWTDKYLADESMTKIAQDYDTNPNVVRKALASAGVRIRRTGEKLNKKVKPDWDRSERSQNSLPVVIDLSQKEVQCFLGKCRSYGLNPEYCWPWLGSSKCNGYGRVTPNANRKSTTAHRHSYTLFVAVPDPKHDVCHTCDHRWCVSPYHLFEGTRQGNMQDAHNKGRGVLGMDDVRIIHESTRQEIQHRLIKGYQYSAISKALKVDFTIIAECDEYLEGCLHGWKSQ